MSKPVQKLGAENDENELILPSPGAPVVIAVDEGRLLVHAHAHEDADGAALLTTITEGLAVHGQRELVLSVRASDSITRRAWLRESALLFEALSRVAADGRRVEAGGYTHFGERGLFGSPRNGVLYVDAAPFADLAMPDRALAMLVLLESEVALVEQLLAYRVLTRLGERARVFPHPTINEAQREAVDEGASEATSFLWPLPRAAVRGLSFVYEEARLTVLVAPRARRFLEAELDKLEGAFALVTDPADWANARFVWRPGQTNPAAISKAGADASRMTGSALLIARGAEEDEVRMVEDGVSLLLTTATWTALKSALLEGRSWSGAMGEIVVDVEPTEEGEARDPARASRMFVKLLSPDPELDAALPSALLARYVGALRDVVEGARELSRGPRQTLVVRAELDSTAGASVVVSASRSEVPRAVLEGLQNAHAPYTRGRIGVEIHFEVGADA